MTAQFLTDADLRHKRTTYQWVTLAPLVFQSEALGRIITIPAGFETDLASIPKFLQSITPNDSKRILEAAIVHDWLYVHGDVARHLADAVLLEGMRVLGSSWLQRNGAWLAVRLFGHAHWAKWRG